MTAVTNSGGDGGASDSGQDSSNDGGDSGELKVARGDSGAPTNVLIKAPRNERHVRYQCHFALTHTHTNLRFANS